ncbi:unnamed protein product [Caenorhabditis brenneri]
MKRFRIHVLHEISIVILRNRTPSGSSEPPACISFYFSILFLNNKMFFSSKTALLIMLLMAVVACNYLESDVFVFPKGCGTEKEDNSEEISEKTMDNHSMKKRNAEAAASRDNSEEVFIPSLESIVNNKRVFAR